ncbi:hypothetical protein CVT24_004995 [Panaeolus cyanescens]|uniref:galacturonan 1,4-alpha-galacturonidase n=1 Tax=Panaeolus cyanescens TaxID=181874 RepID=A0A409V9P1_9AGAR|nr:hypothetical protein CVT24_004995 [Panaeolus cyanescens]
MLFSDKKSIPALIALFASFIAVKAGECTVPASGDGITDDSPAILKAFTDCQKDSIITFTAANYSAFTPISLTDLSNVTVRLNGNLLLPNNMTRVQQAINITQNQASTYATPWFYIQGTDVQILGSDEFEWGQFHGFGQQWWDIGNRILRPQLATFNVTNGLLRGLKVIKPIAWGWNLPGQNIRVENHFVDAMPNNGTRTDTVVSFNLSGRNITVDGYYGHNGDDCISVINGARDIVAKNGYCGFSSHGLSIGSLGRNGAEHTVQNVLFKNWTMEGAVYGARFKSWTGGRGWADNITWEDITLIDVSTGIFITQNYYDQDKGPRPPNNEKTSTRISNIFYKNIKGTLTTNWTDGTCISNPCWNYIDGITHNTGIIFDLFPETALNISAVDIDIKPAPQFAANGTTVLCDPSALVPGEQDGLGFKCHNGPLIITPIVVPTSSALSAYSASTVMMVLVAAFSAILSM